MQHDSVRRVYRVEKIEKKITQIKRKKDNYMDPACCSRPCAKILEKYFKSDWVSFTCVFYSNVIAELFIVREPMYIYICMYLYIRYLRRFETNTWNLK